MELSVKDIFMLYIHTYMHLRQRILIIYIDSPVTGLPISNSSELDKFY